VIEVTRLNGVPMLVNSDLIKIVEKSPDTMVTLIHGEKLIIRESCEELLERILAYRAMLLVAVADRLDKHHELHTIVALSGLSPESAQDVISSASAIAPTLSAESVASKNGSWLKHESNFDSVTH